MGPKRLKVLHPGTDRYQHTSSACDVGTLKGVFKDSRHTGRTPHHSTADRLAACRACWS